VQGNLEGDSEQGYRLRDFTNSIPVALTPTQATESGIAPEQQPENNPVVVIGQVLETEPSSEEEIAALVQGTQVPTPQRYIEVKKIIKLDSELKISEQWMLEVDDLARHVYPQMAAAALGAGATAAQQ
jgi:hypothetical protein